jgi:tRNA dimethylallyltransferase
MWLRALLRGLVPLPKVDPILRAQLHADADALGSPALHARLAGVDPEAAAQVLPDNGRRVVRALEVIALTGRPFSASLPRLEYVDPLTVQVGVDIDRPTLDDRIARRVDEMFAAGFVGEVEALLAQGLGEGRTANRAIGYREVMGFLAGDRTLAEAVEQTKVATRRFARRQDSWFRKDPRIVWVAHDDPDRAEKAVAAVEAVVATAAAEDDQADCQ